MKKSLLIIGIGCLFGGIAAAGNAVPHKQVYSKPVHAKQIHSQSVSQQFAEKDAIIKDLGRNNYFLTKENADLRRQLAKAQGSGNPSRGQSSATDTAAGK